MTPTRSGCALVLLLTLAACSGGNSTVRDPFSRGSGGGATTLRVEVENRNFNDATLHAVSGASRTRLGTVSGKSRAVYRIDWPNPRDVQIEVDLVAGSRFTTRRLNADPGGGVGLIIGTEVQATHFFRIP